MIPLGPLALPVTVLTLLAGMVTALAVGNWLHRLGQPSPENALWLLLATSMVAARAAFVVRWWPEFAAQPLTVLDLRDRGLAPWPGLAALVLAALLIAVKRPRLRRALAWSASAGVLAWGFGTLVALRLADAMNAPLPDLTVRDLEDRPVPLPSLRGRPLVVNLWATWCAPCRREMPVLARAQRARRDVRFAFVDQGESAAEIEAFLRAAHLRPDQVLVDEGAKLSRHFQVRGYPTTLFFDASGRLRSVHPGELSAATLAAELQPISPPPATAPAPPTPGARP